MYSWIIYIHVSIYVYNSLLFSDIALSVHVPFLLICLRA